MKNSDKLLQLNVKETFVRLYALECIIEHLESNVNDPRKKERLRSEVARKTIAKWLQEGEKVYEGRYSEIIKEGS